MRYAFLTLLILVGGCEAAVKRGAERAQEGVETIKAVNDTEAMVLIQAPCAIDLGAYYRVLTPGQRLGADLQCDPELRDIEIPDQPREFTADDLRDLGVIQ